MASSSAPITSGLAFPAGDTEVVQIAYTATDGSAVDLTGYSATWSFGAYAVDGTRGPALVTKASAAGTLAIVVSAGASVLSFTLQPADTASLQPGSYWTQLAVYTPSGSYDGGSDDTLTLTAVAGAAPGAVTTPTPGSYYGSAFALTADTDFITADGGIVKTTGATFADLQAQVLDYLDRPELEAQFPIWIRLFQAKLNRLLRTGGSEAQVTLTPSPITGGAALPNDYQAWRSLTFASGGRTWPLDYVTPDTFALDYPYPYSGYPRFFTIRGTTLFPAPSNGPLTLTYYRGVPAYLSGLLNDWLLLAHFDLYLYGILAEAELYLKNPEGAQNWETQAAAVMTDLIAADRDARWGRARVMMTGPTP